MYVYVCNGGLVGGLRNNVYYVVKTFTEKKGVKNNPNTNMKTEVKSRRVSIKPPVVKLQHHF